MPVLQSGFVRIKIETGNEADPRGGETQVHVEKSLIARIFLGHLVFVHNL